MARRRSSVAGAVLLAALASPVAAKSDQQSFSIPASSLDRALIALGQSSGVDIISTEPGLHQVRTRALAGRLSVRAALTRLLAGSGYRAVKTNSGGYRIVAAPPPRARPRPAPTRSPTSIVPSEVVVTASKQRVPLLRYPGTVTLATGTPILPSGATAALSDLSRVMPVIQSTQLGPGRNKVFIRGIADSSFNGTTLSTASVYLDDVQLSASGPDPGLRLYDVASVEVMEGPQGTLYGAGSIGGVVRLTSNAPDPRAPAASADGGVSLIRSGEAGGDLAAMINLPLATDRLAVRGVTYAARDGGYIDDRGRGAVNVNRVDITGSRLNAAYTPGDGWRVEAGGALQLTRARDGQYSEIGDGPFARRTALAQPFTGDFAFGRAVIEKRWNNGLRLVSATGIADYDTAEVFDATPDGSSAPVTSRVNTEKLLVSHETRLSRSLPDNRSWLIGVTLISDQSVLLRAAGALGSEMDIVGVRNVTRAASAFGETTVTIDRNLSVTLGGRFTIARVDSEPSQIRRAVPYVEGQVTRRLDPTIALSWRLSPELAAFARHQTGFRTGGLAVARGIGRVANFDPDSIDLNEVGVRRISAGARGIDLSLSLSRAHWTNIQADMLSRRGQPYTANIGNATISSVEAAMTWRPAPGWRLVGSALYTDNYVIGALADQSRPDNRRLPETPALGAYADFSYTVPGERRFVPTVGGTVTYVGPSVLGTGDLLDVRQGGYAVGSVSAGLRRGRHNLSLRVDNVTDNGANRFAFGNPFGLTARDQRTPVQPRTVRLGISSAW